MTVIDNVSSIPPYSAPAPTPTPRHTWYIIGMGVVALIGAIVACVAVILYFVFNAEQLLSNDRSYSDVVWMDDDRMVLLRDGGPTFSYSNSFENVSYENGRGIDIVNVARDTRETIAFTDSAEVLTAAGSGTGDVACAAPGILYLGCVSDATRIEWRFGGDVPIESNTEGNGLRLRYNQDGSQLMLIHSSGVYLVDGNAQYRAVTPQELSADVVAAAWHPDGERVALLLSDGNLTVVGYSATDTLLVYFNTTLTASIADDSVELVWQDESRLLIVADTQLIQWNIATNSPINEASRGDYRIAPSALPDGSLVLAAPNNIAIWQPNLEPRQNFPIAAEQVEQVAVNPAGTRVAIFGYDDDSKDKVWAYSLASGELLWSR